MKPVRFHDEAKAEIAHETVYYNTVSMALAERFVRAVEDAVALASEFPAMGTKHTYGTRRYYPKKFPFSVVYTEVHYGILIHAVADARRMPEYWLSRL